MKGDGIFIDRRDMKDLTKLIDDVGKRFPKEINKVLNKMGNKLKKEIMQEVSRISKTGNLRRSISISRARKTKAGIMVARVNINRGNMAFYWHFVEFPSKNRATGQIKTGSDRAFIRNTVARSNNELRDLILRELDRFLK